MMKRKTLPFILALAFLSLTSLFAQTSNYEVTNAVVTTTIANRMPEVQTANNTFASSVERLFYFTKIEQATAPTSILHEWYWQGELLASVELGDLPPRTSLPSKLDLGPFEVHSTG